MPTVFISAKSSAPTALVRTGHSQQVGNGEQNATVGRVRTEGEKGRVLSGVIKLLMVVVFLLVLRYNAAAAVAIVTHETIN
jgi:hypothetical protein